MAKKILIGIGAFIVLVLIVAGIGYYLLTSRPAAPPLPSGLPPEITEVSPEAATRLEKKIDAFNREVKEAQAAGEKKEITLVVTEGEVNSLINKELMGAPPADLPADLKLEEAKVYLREGLLRFDILANIAGIKITAITMAEIAVVDGKPRIKVKSIDFGKLPLPGAVTDRLTNFLTNQLEGMKIIDVPAKVTKVVIGDGQLIITVMT